jgi:hypothetical protein
MIGGVLLVARPPGLFDTRVDDFDVLGKIDDGIANKKGISTVIQQGGGRIQTTNLVLLRVFRTLFNVGQCREMFFMVNRAVVMLISVCLIIDRLP